MRQSLWLIDLSIGSIRKSLLLSAHWFLKLSRLIWKSLDQSVVSEVDEDNGWCSWLLPLSLQLLMSECLLDTLFEDDEEDYYYWR